MVKMLRDTTGRFSFRRTSMTTSLQTWSTFANDKEFALNDSDKSYFRAKTRRHFHNAVLTKFLELSDDTQISKAKLARRLNISPSQITRWLSSPGNWQIDTLSDLLLAMSCQASLFAEELASVGPANYVHPASTESSKEENDLIEQTPTKSEEQTKVKYIFEDKLGLDKPTSTSSGSSVGYMIEKFM